MHLKDLTPGERLVIDRRRRGENQIQAAARLGISLNKYRQWELDQGALNLMVPLNKLEVHEQCFLLRRRDGISREQLSKKLGVCKLWVTLMETGRAPVERLAQFWQLSA